MRRGKGVEWRSVAPWIVFAAVLLAETPILWPGRPVGDAFQFWYAGHLIAIGGSPYDPAAWTAATAYGPLASLVGDNCVDAGTASCLWLYPPWTALVFAPFGALPPETGIPLLRLAVLAAAIVACAVALRSHAGLSGMPLGIALTASALFQPFVISVRTGHPDGLPLLGAILAWRGLGGSVPAFSAGVALVALKPHLLIPFSIVCAVTLVRLRRWRLVATGVLTLGVLGAAGQAATASRALTLDSFMSGSDLKAGLDVATTWSLARAVTPGSVWPLAGALAVLACALIGWRATRRAPNGARDGVAFAALLAFSLAAAPYAHTYDHLLLLPALAIAVRAWPRSALAIVLVALLFPWLAHFVDLAVGSQAPSALVPWLFLALLLASVEVLRASDRAPQAHSAGSER